MTHQKIRPDYKSLSLFRGVSFDAIAEQLAKCSEIEIPGAYRLIAASEPNDSLYLVLSGSLRVDLVDRGSHTLLELGPGECVGEMSILNRDDASADVTSLASSRLLVIEQELVWSMINSSHGVARNLLYILSKRLKAGNEMLLASLEEQRRFEQFATIDPLTGLYNRRWFDANVPRLVARCRQSEQPLSLAIADIDNFKHFNDRYGHLAGDRVLSTVAEIVRTHLRPTDTATRYGGEEFVLLLPEVDAANGYFIAERVRKHLEETPIGLEGGRRSLAVTASIGVAQYEVDMSETDLFAAADEALYSAKQAGRNRVVLSGA